MLRILWFRYDSYDYCENIFLLFFHPFCIMIFFSHWNHNGLTFADIQHSPGNFLKLYFPVGAHYESSFFKSCNPPSINWFICFLSNQVLEPNASLCYFIFSLGLKSDDFTDILLRVASPRLLHNWLILQLCLNPDTRIMMWDAAWQVWISD